MTIYRVKNNTSSALTVAGQYISAFSYYTIQDNELSIWRTNEDVFTFVANGILVVNKGQDNIDDITNPLNGWNYLKGEVTPPSDSLGRWKILFDNPSEEPSKQQFIWSVNIYLNSLSSYQETLEVLPSGKNIYIEQIIAASPDITYKVSLYAIKNSGNSYFMINPLIDPDIIWQFKVDNSTIVSAGSTEIQVSANRDFDLNNIIVSGNYRIHSNYINQQLSEDNVGYYVKIISVNASSKTVKLNSPLDINIDPGAKFTFAERPIIVLAGSGTHIAKTKFPFKINDSYIKENMYIVLNIENTDSQAAGNVSVIIYGYRDV